MERRVLMKPLALPYPAKAGGQVSADREESVRRPSSLVGGRLIQKRFFAIIEPKVSLKGRGGRDGTYENTGGG